MHCANPSGIRARVPGPAALAAGLALALLALALSCSDDRTPLYAPKYALTPPVNRTAYVFAPHPMLNPQKLSEVYGAIVDHLNEVLAPDNIVLKLEASRDYATFNRKLLQGRVHFALPNPYQAWLAQDRGYEIFGKMDGDEEFRGIILVRRDSPMIRLADLKGAVVSFPAPTALAATMMPELHLHNNGVDPRQDIAEVFVGTHESALVSVATGATAAACTWPPAWAKFQGDRPELAQKIEVRWSTETLPNIALIARADLPETVRSKVAAAFFGLSANSRGKPLLEAASCRGFVPASRETYLPVAGFISQYEEAVRPLKGLHE